MLGTLPTSVLSKHGTFQTSVYQWNGIVWICYLKGDWATWLLYKVTSLLVDCSDRVIWFPMSWSLPVSLRSMCSGKHVVGLHLHALSCSLWNQFQGPITFGYVMGTCVLVLVCWYIKSSGVVSQVLHPICWHIDVEPLPVDSSGSILVPPCWSFSIKGPLGLMLARGISLRLGLLHP